MFLHKPQELVVLFQTFRFWWDLQKASNQEDFKIAYYMHSGCLYLF